MLSCKTLLNLNDMHELLMLFL